MKKTIAIAVLSLIFVPVLLDSCHSNNDCDCCSQPQAQKQYSMNALYLSATINGQPAQYRINPKQLRFGFDIDPKYLTFLPREYHGTMGAYADCAPPVPTSKEKFTSVKITSDNILTTTNSQFAIGADLTFQFLVTGFVQNDSMTGLEFSYTPAFSVLQDQQHNFTFVFTLDDGRTFTIDSGHFLLLKDS